MTKEIQQSFREILNMTDWIDTETKRLATEKVDAMTLRIGYPDTILIPEQLNERYKDVSKRKTYDIWLDQYIILLPKQDC